MLRPSGRRTPHSYARTIQKTPHLKMRSQQPLVAAMRDRYNIAQPKLHSVWKGVQPLEASCLFGRCSVGPPCTLEQSL
jgi:hypothetical protein